MLFIRGKISVWRRLISHRGGGNDESDVPDGDGRRSDKIEGGDGGGEGDGIRRRRSIRYQTMGVVTVELLMSRTLRSIDSRPYIGSFSLPNVAAGCLLSAVVVEAS